MINENIIKLENSKFERSLINKFAIFIVFVGLLIIVFFFIFVNSHYSIASKGEKVDMATPGQIGEFIGGIVGTLFSLVSIILLIITLRDQKDSFKKERFEQRFFEMIKLHRDNVSELTYTTYIKQLNSKNEYETITYRDEGRKVFKTIFTEFKDLSIELKAFFDVSEDSVYLKNYLDSLRSNKTLQERKIDLIKYAKIDILYCMIFFGLSKAGIDTIKIFFKDRYDEDFYIPILKYASLKPKQESPNWLNWLKYSKMNKERRFKMLNRWVMENKTKKIDIPAEWTEDENITYSQIFLDNKYIKYYGGHQSRLGHYFRHFYQSVTYINSNNLIDYDEKYENVKFLRGQLSTFEQLMIFLNSISVLGRVWELEKRNKPEKTIALNNQLITKYNLVKNIYNDIVIDEIRASHFYPLVSYEANFDFEKKEQRFALKKQFS